jgi:hypothetical protein
MFPEPDALSLADGRKPERWIRRLLRAVLVLPTITPKAALDQSQHLKSTSSLPPTLGSSTDLVVVEPLSGAQENAQTEPRRGAFRRLRECCGMTPEQ